MSMRGAAAIVGVTDEVSPSGELPLRGRALEAKVFRDALDDAGVGGVRTRSATRGGGEP